MIMLTVPRRGGTNSRAIADVIFVIEHVFKVVAEHVHPKLKIHSEQRGNLVRARVALRATASGKDARAKNELLAHARARARARAHTHTYTPRPTTGCADVGLRARRRSSCSRSRKPRHVRQ